MTIYSQTKLGFEKNTDFEHHRHRYTPPSTIKEGVCMQYYHTSNHIKKDAENQGKLPFGVELEK